MSGNRRAAESRSGTAGVANSCRRLLQTLLGPSLRVSELRKGDGTEALTLPTLLLKCEARLYCDDYGTNIV